MATYVAPFPRKGRILMSAQVRVEVDLLGEKEVPAAAYYGVHTQRAIEISLFLE